MASSSGGALMSTRCRASGSSSVPRRVRMHSERVPRPLGGISCARRDFAASAKSRPRALHQPRDRRVAGRTRPARRLRRPPGPATRPRLTTCGRTLRPTQPVLPFQTRRHGARRAQPPPTALGPPDPAAAREALEVRPARPSSQSGAPCGSGLPRRRSVDRRRAHLCAGADHAAPARMLLTMKPAPVRVREGGGGGPRGRCGRRLGNRCLRGRGAEGCLSQCRELECRTDGLSHPLAERAIAWPACRQRGEHVFVKGREGVGRNGRRGSLVRERHLALRRGKRGPILQALLQTRSTAAVPVAPAPSPPSERRHVRSPPGPSGANSSHHFPACQ